MIITAIRSDAIYRKMKDAAPAEKENIYRDELMKPFEFKWACVGIPLKAETEGGCDVVSAAAMSGYYAPAQAQQRLWRRRSRFILDESALKLINIS